MKNEEKRADFAAGEIFGGYFIKGKVILASPSSLDFHKKRF